MPTHMGYAHCVTHMVKRPIHRLGKDGPVPELDELAEESIITIRCNGQTVVRLLASPFDLGDLANGHIICEGRGNVDTISVDGYEVNITGNVRNRPIDDLLTAACGACTTGDVEIPRNIVSNSITLRSDLSAMMNLMKLNQPWFEATGGMHAAALFDENGELLIIREDIGRHNAVDKVVGGAIRNDLAIKIMGLSGRIGWELVAKAVRADIEIIVAVGAISSAAENLARASGMTLVGFAASKTPAVVGSLSRIIDKPSVNP